jgi:hypothetical protein
MINSTVAHAQSSRRALISSSTTLSVLWQLPINLRVIWQTLLLQGTGLSGRAPASSVRLLLPSYGGDNNNVSKIRFLRLILDITEQIPQKELTTK